MSTSLNTIKIRMKSDIRAGRFVPGATTRQKKIVEITGLANLKLDEQDNTIAEEGFGKGETQTKSRLSVLSANPSKTPNVGKHQKADVSEPKTPNAKVLESLPVVSLLWDDDDLRSELRLRDPTALVTDDKNKAWLLDQLKSGTISILKATEELGSIVVDKLPRVSTSMNLEQLKREFLHRHPSKKRLTRGKWRDWYIFQLGMGSICVAPEEKPITLQSKSAAGSPQASISNTVSTAPTIFSTGGEDTLSFSSSTKEHNMHGCLVQGTEQPETRVEEVSVERKSTSMTRSVMASKMKHYGVSKAARWRASTPQTTFSTGGEDTFSCSSSIKEHNTHGIFVQGIDQSGVMVEEVSVERKNTSMTRSAMASKASTRAARWRTSTSQMTFSKGEEDTFPSSSSSIKKQCIHDCLVEGTEQSGVRVEEASIERASISITRSAMASKASKAARWRACTLRTTYTLPSSSSSIKEQNMHGCLVQGTDQSGASESDNRVEAVSTERKSMGIATRSAMASKMKHHRWRKSTSDLNTNTPELEPPQMAKPLALRGEMRNKKKYLDAYKATRRVCQSNGIGSHVTHATRRHRDVSTDFKNEGQAKSDPTVEYHAKVATPDRKKRSQPLSAKCASTERVVNAGKSSSTNGTGSSEGKTAAVSPLSLVVSKSIGSPYINNARAEESTSFAKQSNKHITRSKAGNDRAPDVFQGDSRPKGSAKWISSLKARKVSRQTIG